MGLSQPTNKPVLKTFDLTGKVIAVTGGSRGIGLEVSRGYAEAGADVALIYSSTNAESIAAEISERSYVKAAAYKCNVTSQEEVEATLQKIASDFGKLDVVVVNSGIASHGPAEDCTTDEWSKLMSVNLDGAFYTAQAAGRIFKAQGHGNVIFTASVSAVLVNTPQKQAAYNASKAAVVHLAKSLAVEWVDFCRVNCISPGYIATDMIGELPQDWKDKWFQDVPAKRLCAPYELKGPYVFCASDASSYMTGSNIVIDGGYNLP
ncbi:hypothetical protein FQN54_004470 [Arachnomyces sp. PD_36]|nr:hypothetical protein FQN54_004470 [Arachnomyces sp. PD_36]